MISTKILIYHAQTTSKINKNGMSLNSNSPKKNSSKNVTPRDKKLSHNSISSITQDRALNTDSLSEIIKKEERKTNHSEKIGIAHIPNLKHKIFLSTPNYFNIVIAGSENKGKTSFLKSLNLPTDVKTETHFYDIKMNKKDKNNKKEKFNLLKFKEYNYKIFEDLSIFQIKIIEIDSVGDSVDNSNFLEPIKSFLNKQNEIFYEKEKTVNSEELQDLRIHAFLYFFDGSSPRQVDIQLMKDISQRCNLIMCNAKSDNLTSEEISRIRDSSLYKNISSFGGVEFIMQPNRKYLYGKMTDRDTLRKVLFEKHILKLKNKTDNFYAKFKEKMLIKSLLKNDIKNEDAVFLRNHLNEL